MTPDIQAEIRRMYAALEPAFKEVRPQYPLGCCVWSCAATREMLNWELNASLLGPAVGIRHVEGDFDHSYHAWLEVTDIEEGDGVWIVDPTLDQFHSSFLEEDYGVLSGSCGIIPPDHPLQDRYERDTLIWCSNGGHLR
jgi:hypothetical protein